MLPDEDDLEQLLGLAAALHVGMDTAAIARTVEARLQPLIGERTIRLTLATADPQQSNGVPDDSTVAGRRREAGARESFALVAGDMHVGALEVISSADDGAQPLSDRQRRLLERVSPLVARAVSNAQRFRQVQRDAAVDSLTGCHAIRRGLDLVNAELARARRYARPTALLFIDLDRFKQVNDRDGHAVGDALLRAVGAALKSALRASDLCCRYGGDEFVVLLPETDLDGARHVAEALRRRLAATPVTASIGVAAARPDETDADSLLARADAAMYDAKRAGRNTVRAREDQFRVKPTRQGSAKTNRVLLPVGVVSSGVRGRK